MSCEMKTQHAKLLAQIVTQSSHWSLQPEKKPPFKSLEDAFEYFDSHNEPLYIRVPVTDNNGEVLVRVCSEGDDVCFETISFENTKQAKVHHSHLKLIESTVAELVNEQLPEGSKAASF